MPLAPRAPARGSVQWQLQAVGPAPVHPAERLHPLYWTPISLLQSPSDPVPRNPDERTPPSIYTPSEMLPPFVPPRASVGAGGRAVTPGAAVPLATVETPTEVVSPALEPAPPVVESNERTFRNLQRFIGAYLSLRPQIGTPRGGPGGEIRALSEVEITQNTVEQMLAAVHGCSSWTECERTITMWALAGMANRVARPSADAGGAPRAP